MPPKFTFDWYPGGTGQLEVSGPTANAPGKFRYTPPFRATLRPPAEESLLLKSSDLDQIYKKLDGVVNFFTSVSSRKASGNQPSATTRSAIRELEGLGDRLLTLVLPDRVRTALRTNDLYLEIGTDESLANIPWELMFDESHLSLTNYVGRFVNLSKKRESPAARPATVYGADLEKLKVLIISVPKTDMKGPGDSEYRELDAARKETERIVTTLSGVSHVELSILQDATFDQVYEEFRGNQHHIIHFNGHASANPTSPMDSGLVLKDQILTTGQLAGMFGRRPAVFCFLNACETTQVQKNDSTWQAQHNLFGIASTLLDTGAYLLGSTWEIEDETAADFAEAFYRSFLSEGKPLGYATREARKAVRKAAKPDDVGWASYTLFGDPRLYVREAADLRLKPSAPAPAATGPSEPQAGPGA